jgi:hypothetical protein
VDLSYHPCSVQVGQASCCLRTHTSSWQIIQRHHFSVQKSMSFVRFLILSQHRRQCPLRLIRTPSPVRWRTVLRKKGDFLQSHNSCPLIEGRFVHYTQITTQSGAPPDMDGPRVGGKTTRRSVISPAAPGVRPGCRSWLSPGREKSFKSNDLEFQ